VATSKPLCQSRWKVILIVLVAYDEVVNVKTHTVKDRVIALNRTTVSCIYICTLDDGRQFVRMEYDDIGAIVDDRALSLARGIL
jgi:hypothetical protein